jgi:phospholipid/cholesterol/gamma-HCH transport system substrate-binding protein
MPRRSVAEVLTGALVLLVAAGFLAYAVAHSGRSTAGGYPLHAVFDNIAGLPVGSDVRVAGVKVGSVTAASIDPQTYQANVTLTVRDDIRVPKDSSAEITSESLLGGKYVALSPGGDATMLQPGQTIAITQGSISIEQLLGKYIFSSGQVSGSGGSQSGSQAGGGSGGLAPLGGGK